MIEFIEQDEIEIQGTRYAKGEVLMFKNVPLLKVETNKNRDVLSEANAQEIAASIALKPISLEHERGRMAGIFTEGRFVAPYVMTDGLVYAKHVPAADIEDLQKGDKFLSIEASADSATCSVCSKEFSKEADYCNHLQAKSVFNAYRHLKGAHATGGGIVANPAGSDTRVSKDSVTFVASLLEVNAKDYSAEERKELAKKGEALADGSFPIVNGEDLSNALQAFLPENTEAKAHITARAKSLGMEDKLPKDWVTGEVETPQEEDELTKVKAALQEAISKLTQQESVVPQMQSKIEALEKENKGLLENMRHQQLVGGGHLSEDEWAAKKESIMKMDDGGIELLASRQTARLVLSSRSASTVVTEQKPKPKLVLG